nr:MAG TPA: hypothetical protein [Caudoviricetes sp.]
MSNKINIRVSMYIVVEYISILLKSIKLCYWKHSILSNKIENFLSLL